MKFVKHYSNASNSTRLNLLIDKYGLEGYGRYWLFVETLTDQWDGSNEEIQIHIRTLTSQLQYYKWSATKQWLVSLESLDLIGWSLENDVITIKTDIMLKLKGKSYSKRIHIMNDSKIKELRLKNKDPRSKIEEKDSLTHSEIEINSEIKIDETKIIDPYRVMDLWNQHMVPQFPIAKSFPNSQTRIFLEQSQFIGGESGWIDIFDKCKESEFLRKAKGFSFNWLFDEKKISALINGQYFDDGKDPDEAVSQVHETWVDPKTKFVVNPDQEGDFRFIQETEIENKRGEMLKSPGAYDQIVDIWMREWAKNWVKENIDSKIKAEVAY